MYEFFECDYYIFLHYMYYIYMELYFSNFRPLTCFSVMITDAVKYNFDLLMMSTKVLETYRGILSLFDSASF